LKLDSFWRFFYLPATTADGWLDQREEVGEQSTDFFVPLKRASAMAKDEL
jgi:hypothetical protein